MNARESIHPNAALPSRASPPASLTREPHLVLCREPAEPATAWTTRAFDEDVPPATLGDARARRDELRTLLTRERAAAADFLLALADFDRRRGWERLGHASLFSFLTRELGLSAGAAQLRLSAARLLPRHPAVEAALRDGRLCLSAAGQLARVLTPANEAEVLPRFFGCSSREAQEVAAALLPAPAVRRELVTPVAMVRKVEDPLDRPSATPASTLTNEPPSAPAPITAALLSSAAPPSTSSLHAHEVEGRTGPRPSTPQVVPLTADLRRLHLTVTAGFLEQVAKARTGLSHALPGATTEQVLEAALAALLEKQARRKGLGRRALAARAKAGPLTPRPLPASGREREGTIGSATATPRPAPPQAPRHAPRQERASSSAPAPARPDVPAALAREVRLRDGERCTYPLDAGGTCGSTWQVELDHVVPVALSGETTLANLRCLCRRHNQAAAREALGSAADQRRPGR